jgi:hypothetical protein
MPSMEDPQQGSSVGARALEAVSVGITLNDDHPADPGALRSIGTCQVCGILSYQAGDGSWKHVPAIEECDGAHEWIRQHHLSGSAAGGSAHP